MQFPLVFIRISDTISVKFCRKNRRDRQPAKKAGGRENTTTNELKYYTIGKSYGGSQDWFTDRWMYRGGCGAITACDSCIYLARYKNLPSLYPFDANHVTREDYLAFGQIMKPYLRPRVTGIDKTRIFIAGFNRYMTARHEHSLRVSSLEGHEDVALARETIRRQIEQGFPVPYLMLRHQDRRLDSFSWHWFLLNGYREKPGAFLVKAVTYGEWHWLDLARLWDTGHAYKGGIILFSQEDTAPAQKL